MGTEVVLQWKNTEERMGLSTCLSCFGQQCFVIRRVLRPRQGTPPLNFEGTRELVIKVRLQEHLADHMHTRFDFAEAEIFQPAEAVQPHPCLYD